MDLIRISKNYFNKSFEEKKDVCEKVLKFYLDEMIATESSLEELKEHFERMKVQSIERDEYEITEILDTLIQAMNTLDKDKYGL